MNFNIDKFKNFSKFYNQKLIENNIFYYPFSLIKYKNYISMHSIGYQGIFPKKEFTKADINNFLQLIRKYCKDNNILVEFIRFNPFFDNHNIVKNFLPIEYANDFLSIKIDDYENYIKTRPVRYRNALKKTKNLELKINIKNSIIINALKYRNDFINSDKTIYDLINNKLAVLFSAYINNNEIASSLFLIIDNIAYYIANYSTNDAKEYNSNVYLINEFYKYAVENNIDFIGLGGGINKKDSLWKFKEQFATHTMKIYHSKITHNDIYNDIKMQYKSDYFPAYLNDVNILDYRV